jgi:hypothetical protein
MKYVLAIVLASAASTGWADEACTRSGNDTYCSGTEGDQNCQTSCHDDGLGHSYCNTNYH